MLVTEEVEQDGRLSVCKSELAETEIGIRVASLGVRLADNASLGHGGSVQPVGFRVGVGDELVEEGLVEAVVVVGRAKVEIIAGQTAIVLDTPVLAKIVQAKDDFALVVLSRRNQGDGTL